MITLIDINGFQITVTDIEAAIKQAKLFKGFKHDDPMYNDFDLERNHYWQDIYEKLLSLNAKQIDST
ncbi:MAG: hypothetical protein ABI675_20045 [Chitinophagaceae bacterium]